MSALERVLDRRALLRGTWEGAPVRPPGAVGDRRFNELCDACGDCAKACPADAIRMAGPGTDVAAVSPVIVATESPCVMCDGLLCASACPTGALEPVTPETMKIAEVDFRADRCWSAQGVDPNCDYCFDRCPLKGVAITYRRGQGPTIVAESCTGCGSCVHFCPSQPKALTIRAR